MSGQAKHLAEGASLHRRTGVALWRQISDQIRAGLSLDLADAAGRLPPEVELARRFSVNRHTVRAAIAALVSEGVLRAEQGRGTFVARHKRLAYPISRRTRFSAGFETQSRKSSNRLVATRIEPAAKPVAEALGLQEGGRTARLDIVGEVDGVPVSRSTSWFDANRFKGIAQAYRRTGSITRALALMGVADYVRHSTIVEARHAKSADIEALRLAPGAIVLVTRALNTGTDGIPIQFSETRFAADRVELQINHQ